MSKKFPHKFKVRTYRYDKSREEETTGDKNSEGRNRKRKDTFERERGREEKISKSN